MNLVVYSYTTKKKVSKNKLSCELTVVGSLGVASFPGSCEPGNEASLGVVYTRRNGDLPLQKYTGRRVADIAQGLNNIDVPSKFWPSGNSPLTGWKLVSVFHH